MNLNDRIIEHLSMPGGFRDSLSFHDRCEFDGWVIGVRFGTQLAAEGRSDQVMEDIARQLREVVKKSMDDIAEIDDEDYSRDP